MGSSVKRDAARQQQLPSYRYRVVDVFTQNLLEGNSLAVFPDASGLDDLAMQQIARELNLSETTFVFPATRPGCAANVRIFTPAKEMSFAGHPTIGTSFVLLEEGIITANDGHFSLEEKIGAVPVRIDKGERPLIWLSTPPIQEGRSYQPESCARALGLEPHDLLDVAPQFLSAGNPTVFIAVKDKTVVDRAWLDLSGMAAFKTPGQDPLCVFIFAPAPEGAYSRMFAPEYGIPEDPATGSSTGPLARYMMRHSLISRAAGTRFVSEQGARMGRRSILHVHIRGENGVEGIDVGGYVTPVAEAKMKFSI
jgi:trans-2,3-dihydro-3-hydroxyanthranilate isomerase